MFLAAQVNYLFQLQKVVEQLPPMANPVITAQKVTTDYHYVPCENDELLDLQVAQDEKDYTKQV